MTSPQLPSPGTLAMAATALHEMFLSMQAAGFTTWEALYFMAVMTSQQQGPQPPGSHDS